MTTEFDYLITLALNISDEQDIYLSHGLLGNCIFCDWYYKQTGIDKYEVLAEQYLSKVFHSSLDKPYLNLENGLSGIGIGVYWLYTQHFLQGDINELLQPLDSYIYKVITEGLNKENIKSGKYIDSILDVLVYLSVRLHSNIEPSSTKKIMELFAIYLLNWTFTHRSENFYDEPKLNTDSYKIVKFLFALTKLYELHFYDYRIERILRELKVELCTHIPLYQYNRLVLYTSLTHLNKRLKLDFEWEWYIHLLKENISINYILYNELMDYDMFFTKGLTGLYCFVKRCELYGESFTVTPQDFYHRITSANIISNIKSEISSIPKGLDGILGLIMLLIVIKNHQ